MAWSLAQQPPARPCDATIPSTRRTAHRSSVWPAPAPPRFTRIQASVRRHCPRAQPTPSLRPRRQACRRFTTARSAIPPTDNRRLRTPNLALCKVPARSPPHPRFALRQKRQRQSRHQHSDILRQAARRNRQRQPNDPLSRLLRISAALRSSAVRRLRLRAPATLHLRQLRILRLLQPRLRRVNHPDALRLDSGLTWRR
jgi:hypothetical protein